jgi:hypothetical protein
MTEHTFDINVRVTVKVHDLTKPHIVAKFVKERIRAKLHYTMEHDSSVVKFQVDEPNEVPKEQ